MSSILISPSILSADFSKLGEEVSSITHAGAGRIHIDIMDGHFVPNLTIGPQIVKAIRPYSSLPFDVHLMNMSNALFLKEFADAGADSLTIHVELDNFPVYLQKIKKLGKQVGLSIKPETPVEILEPYLNIVDMILVMSVNPGFGGQHFMPIALDKIRWLKEPQQSNTYLIAVDGGVNHENKDMIIKAGADILVAGTAVFQGGPTKYASNIKSLRK